MTELRIRLDPFGADRFVIVFADAAWVIRQRITGGDPAGLTEADLRGTGGLSKLGLSESQIDREIAVANAKRP